MKKFNILILMLFIQLSFNIETKAQEDTVIIENSTEPIKESDYKQKRKYKYLDNNFREEKTILKLEITPLSFWEASYEFSQIFKNIEINIGFEQKIGKSFSIVCDNDFKYFYASTYYMDWSWANDLGFRYYYLMKKRVDESIGSNNFHSNYFSIEMDDWINYGFNNIELTFKPYLNISWGMQRRIGKLGIVDVGPYFKYRPEDYEIGLNLLIGLARGFKK